MSIYIFFCILSHFLFGLDVYIFEVDRIDIEIQLDWCLIYSHSTLIILSIYLNKNMSIKTDKKRRINPQFSERQVTKYRCFFLQKNVW